MDLQRAYGPDGRGGSLAKVGAYMFFITACILLASSLVVFGSAAISARSAVPVVADGPTR